MNFRVWVLLAGAGSGALLLGALGFQYLGEMAPCKLCYWQRYPHVVAIGFAVLAWLLQWRWLALAGAGAALASGGIGAYHTGVERGWWEGPGACSAGGVDGLSAQELLDQIMAAPLVRCDEVAWEMFGLSMASWNFLASGAVALIWLLAAQARLSPGAR